MGGRKEGRKALHYDTILWQRAHFMTSGRQREGERERAIQVYKTDTAREEEEEEEEGRRERLINQ